MPPTDPLRDSPPTSESTRRRPLVVVVTLLGLLGSLVGAWFGTWMMPGSLELSYCTMISDERYQPTASIYAVFRTAWPEPRLDRVAISIGSDSVIRVRQGLSCFDLKELGDPDGDFLGPLTIALVTSRMQSVSDAERTQHSAEIVEYVQRLWSGGWKELGHAPWPVIDWSVEKHKPGWYRQYEQPGKAVYPQAIALVWFGTILACGVFCTRFLARTLSRSQPKSELGLEAAG